MVARKPKVVCGEEVEEVYVKNYDTYIGIDKEWAVGSKSGYHSFTLLKKNVPKLIQLLMKVE